MNSDELERERKQVIHDTPTAQRAEKFLDWAKNDSHDIASWNTNQQKGHEVSDNLVSNDNQKETTEQRAERLLEESEDEGPNNLKFMSEVPAANSKIRTPDLGRLKAFIQNDKSPFNTGFKARLGSSPIDTPQSQRLKPDFGRRETPSNVVIERLKENEQKKLNLNSSICLADDGGNELNDEADANSSTSTNEETSPCSPLSGPEIIPSGTPLARKAPSMRVRKSQDMQPRRKSGTKLMADQKFRNVVIPASNSSPTEVNEGVIDDKVQIGHNNLRESPLQENATPVSVKSICTAEVDTQPIDDRGNNSASTALFEGSATQVDVSFPIPSLMSGPDLVVNNSQSPLINRFTYQQGLRANWQDPDKSGPIHLISSPQAVSSVHKEAQETTTKFCAREEATDQEMSDQSPSDRYDGRENGEEDAEKNAWTYHEEGEELNDSDKRIRLRFSNILEHQKDSATVIEQETEENLVFSDVEKTQELPEIDDGAMLEVELKAVDKELLTNNEAALPLSSPKAEQENEKLQTQCSFEESQEVVKNRRQLRRKKQMNDSSSISHEYNKHELQLVHSSPLKRPKTTSGLLEDGSAKELIKHGENVVYDEVIGKKAERLAVDGAPSRFFPTSTDDSFLSKKDLIFPDAVWCHYDFNYIYYPGKICNANYSSESVEVLFESGVSVIKREDVHYLDLKVGEVVIWDSKPYTVIALERRSDDANAIRCIRGYDTVHLKKKNKTGCLGKRVLIKPIASITLTLDLWAKRAKIVLSSKTPDREHAFEDLRHPIRGRKSTTLVTPDTPSRGSLEQIQFLGNESPSASTDSADLAMSKTLGTNATTNQPVPNQRGIFDRCLFVLTGVNESKRKELSTLIEKEGGTVSRTSFSGVFNLESLKVGLYQNIDLNSLKFSCLITERHSRSSKYLETLALGWPTLHYKFVTHCVYQRKLAIDSIFRFLLPSGETYRLSVNSANKSGVVKSNNIFHFYSCLIAGKSIKQSLQLRQVTLWNYRVVICGSSELDTFVEFVFRALGVASIDTWKSNNYRVEDLEDKGRIPSSLVNHVREMYTSLPKNFCLLLYLNIKNGRADTTQLILDNMKSLIDAGTNLHVEDKEWLIQTIINEDHGHGEISRPN